MHRLENLANAHTAQGESVSVLDEERRVGMGGEREGMYELGLGWWVADERLEDLRGRKSDG